MRSTDKRIAAVNQRTAELKNREKNLKNGVVGLCSMVACLVLIVGLGFSMPDIMIKMEAMEALENSDMASIFAVGNTMGYVLIALLSFILGACVT
ncbi:MAG: DUF4179 domain-containing protein, partial [Clostridiales bacterium]